jgi:alanine racemase
MYRKRAEISRDLLAQNGRYCKSVLVNNAKLMAVVKANAYGHGSVQASRILLENGVDWLGVSSLGEALVLRQNGIEAPILNLGYIPPENILEAIENDITLTICDLETAEQMNRVGKKAIVHIKVDTGMNRLGFYAKSGDISKSVNEIKQISVMDNIEIQGIFTHFWGEMRSECEGQYNNFLKLIYELKKVGVDPEIKHCCNSNATFLFPEMHMDMCRVGKGLWGYYNPNVVPAMEFKTIIVATKALKKDEGVGYNHAYIADSERKIAILPVGYADGYFRCLSGRASVVVNGQNAPVIGNICMDQMMIDITDIKKSPKIGDEVLLYGREGVTAGMVADWADTIYSEVLCAIGRRVPRVYI